MLELDNVRDHNALGLTDEQVLAMYRSMLLARRLDERMWALNRQGRVPFVVSVAGHEACQVGAAFALNPQEDWSLPYYRDIAFNIALGVSPLDIFYGVFSKAADPSSGGRQMPNHWSEPDLNVFTHSSVIATQFPHACGIAHELKTSGRPGVVAVMSGEGATSEGDWHEAMNFAAIHKLPIIFLIENNLYAISVPFEQEVAGGVATRAEGYGMPGIEIDGNDVLQVYGVVAAAKNRAREGKGPTLIEAKTYRYYAHTSDDDDKLYRSAEEVELWRRKDPIGVLRQYLVESRLLDEATEQRIDNEVTDTIAAAVKQAEAAEDPQDALSHVYANPIEPTTPATEPEQLPQGEQVNLITAVNRTLHEILDAYPNASTFGEDVADPKGGVFKATVGLTEKFGEARSFNAPLAESLIIGVGIGKAAAGGRPIAEIQFADFIHPGFDQIVSEAARISYRTNGRWNCPLVIRVPYGGGIHGALYHSQSIEAFYTHVPGLKVVVPSTPADAKGLLRSAIDDPDPVMVLEPKKLYRLAKGVFPQGDFKVPIGKAAVRRVGYDVTIIAYGAMAHYAVEAADRLAEEGIEAYVLDLRSLRPLDWPSIEAAVQHNGKVIIVHEDTEFAGFGAEIAAQISEKAFDWLDAPVQRYCAPEAPTFPFAGSLEKQLLPNTDGIVERARALAKY
ncbi:MAG TPA: thiamine pyrophosphate-dependent enzyme [Acidimicrobiia bacterium]|jgi:2-oxoisovalerate dehydrogenase E1 component|nr:thiamine pyrophosphate-dependent enzyme [Acidimicrobiia bacterium]